MLYSGVKLYHIINGSAVAERSFLTLESEEMGHILRMATTLEKKERVNFILSIGGHKLKYLDPNIFFFK